MTQNVKFRKLFRIFQLPFILQKINEFRTNKKNEKHFWNIHPGRRGFSGFTGRKSRMNTLAKDMIETGKKLYRQGYIVATEGNISCRLGTGNILSTRSGVCKGELTGRDLVEIDPAGKPVSTGKPSTEIKMHLAVYRLRPEINAVIHAHSPYAVSLTLAGISLARAYTPESVLLLGAVPVASYARPSTGAVPDSIAGYIKKTDIILLERHGSLTAGKNLQEAFHKLEILECTARTVWLAHQLGPVLPLPDEEVQGLLSLRQTVYGLDYPIMPFA